MKMADNILNSTVTYASLIDSASTALYNKLSGSGLSAGTYRTNSATFTIGSGVSCGHKRGSWVSQAKSVTLTETENRNETYTPPTKATIINDITNFMNAVGVPTNNTNPTPEGAISFFFALNFFVEKAVIKRASTSPNNGDSTYHLHYKAPSASSYNKIPYNYIIQNTITTDKITTIYNQLKSTSLLSDNVRGMNIASAAHTSSCSSSSCSSVFIAYYNLN